MSTADWYVLFGSVCSYMLMLGVHELRAVKRETRAIARHDIQMRALADANRGYLAAINQRARLDERLTALEVLVSKMAVKMGIL